jgi:predicted AlkP superfamily phosphohydrolase/phosphomutase
MQHKNKVIVIGIDGATFNLILPWAKEEKLPTFAELLKEGTYKYLQSVPPYNSAVDWVSIYTGKLPGGHAVFDFLKVDKQKGIRFINSNDIKSEVIWIKLLRYGKKIILINVPLSFTSEIMTTNSIVVSSFEKSEREIFTYPPELTYRLRENGYIIEALDKPFVRGDENKLISRIQTSLEKRQEVALKLMTLYEWDFFFVIFTETDRLQHFFWKYNEDKTSRYRNVLLNHYRKLDDFIKKIIERIDENTSLFIISDHGFGPLEGEFHLGAWLYKIGLMKYRSSWYKWLIETKFTQQEILNTLKKCKISRVFRNIFGNNYYIDKLTLPPYIKYKHINQLESHAFPGGYATIYINTSSENYEHLRRLLIKKLEIIKSPKDKKKIFNSIVKREEIYKGPYISEAPDIIIKNGEYDPMGGVGYSTLFDLKPLKTGTHREYGIFILWDRSKKKKIKKEARIVDVYPTILRVMNLPIPSELDGKPLF